MEHPCVYICKINGTSSYKFSRGDLGASDDVTVIHVCMTNSIESAKIAEKIFDIACTTVCKNYINGTLTFEEHKEYIYNELLDTCVLISDNYVCNELNADIIYVKETDNGYKYKILRNGIYDEYDSLPNILGEHDSIDSVAKYLEGENDVVMYE